MATATHEHDGPVHRPLPRPRPAEVGREASPTAQAVLGLQRSVGNAATAQFVQRLAEAPGVQRACDCGGSCPTCSGGGAAAEPDTADAG
jgi:hypothetical protein